ncbi:MAG: phosphoribosylglycinamide formyltransferase [Phycisphaeraceae bacterium JB051]
MTEPQTCPSGHLKLAVLLSGSGRTLQNIADAIADGKLDAEITTVISSLPDVYGLTRAEKLGLPTHIIRRKDYADLQAFADANWQLIRDSGADYVCLAGYMTLLPVPRDFVNRVINIHPALLPSFGGKGMYGHHVHEAVIEHGAKVSGCTVHFCDDTYDTGPILVQRVCPVLADDDADVLADRVFEQETIAYIEALEALCQGRVSIDGGRALVR